MFKNNWMSCFDVSGLNVLKRSASSIFLLDYEWIECLKLMGSSVYQFRMDCI